jgi:TolB-like protein/Flp pilus assembly protein TadD
MPADSGTEAPLETAYVLFMDVVGYSKLLVNEQRDVQQQLNEIVRRTEQFRSADAAGKLISIPAGDGMALVFFDHLEAPVQCAIEITEAAKNHPHLQLRMGINSGPVNQVRDVNNQINVAGAGINLAQRIMDCADAGHILLSKRVAEDLAQSQHWQPHLYDLGECAVKHGVGVFVVNLFTGEVGNPRLPEKIKKAKEERDAAAAAFRMGYLKRWKLIAGAAVVLAAVIAFIIYERRPFRSASGEVIPAKSIAVLPFENYSDEKENAFFADGIQDDILTALARIQGLRVISRTSVAAFRGSATPNLREIGRILGIANALEGSVRREGNQVVVSAQLIDALHDRQIWARRYERTLDDSLGLQGELAAEIADALRVSLSPDEKARVAKKPTGNSQAYVFYLRAVQIARNPDTLLEDYKKAEQFYVEAITLDPNFALAHAQLASTRAQIFHYHEPTDVWKTKARAEAEIALRLQPNLAEGHLALGQCIYWIDQDYERAVQEFDKAARLSPNNADVSSLMAAIKRRQGKWQESLERYESSQRIDPQNANIVRNLIFTNTALRRWSEAARWAEAMRNRTPASLVGRIQSGYVDFWWRGDTSVLKGLLNEVPAGTDPDGVVTSCKWEVAMIERDYASAEKVLAASPLTELSYTSTGLTPKSFLEGCTALARGDVSGAQKQFELARPIFEKDAVEAPANADVHAYLGWLYGFMGRKDDAIREARRAVELKPESKDAVDGAIMNCYLALVYARVGESDLAFPLLERLLKTPGAVDSADYSVTVNDLKYRWEWDPIRKDPRFQKLLETPPQ